MRLYTIFCITKKIDYKVGKGIRFSLNIFSVLGAIYKMCMYKYTKRNICDVVYIEFIRSINGNELWLIQKKNSLHRPGYKWL